MKDGSGVAVEVKFSHLLVSCLETLTTPWYENFVQILSYFSQVHEPLEADSLLENMRTTYDKFEPNKTSMVERSLERLFGDVSKGKKY